MTDNPPRNTVIKGQPHYLAYITPEEGDVLKERGGAGLPGPMGIPSYFDVGEGLGGYGSGMKDDATAGTGDPDANRGVQSDGTVDTSTYADYQQGDLSDDKQYAAAQSVFNQARGITTSNPYGFDGFFSRVLGINPKNISYPDLNKGRTGTVFKDGIISRGGVMQGIPAAQYNAMFKTPAQRIADNQFSKFINPTNDETKPGYNPEFPSAQEMGPGKLRSGVEKAGYQTTLGPVMEQAREQSTGEMIARGVAGLFGGLPGLALGQIGTKEYGLPGQPGFEDFDPNNPRPGGGMLGQVLGGVNPTQALTKTGSGIGQLMDSVTDFFKPEVPEPVAADVTPVTTQPNRTGFEERRSDISNMYPNAGNYGSRFGAGEQLAGNLTDTLEDFLFEQFLSDEAKEALREKGISIDQISPSADPSSFPITPAAPEPPPDIMQMIKDATRTSELGGPSTANQVAMLDFSNLFNVGDGMYRSTPDPSLVDKALDKLGIKALPKRSKGQIKSSTVKSEPLFDLDRFNLFSGS